MRSLVLLCGVVWQRAVGCGAAGGGAGVRACVGERAACACAIARAGARAGRACARIIIIHLIIIFILDDAGDDAIIRVVS